MSTDLSGSSIAHPPYYHHDQHSQSDYQHRQIGQQNNHHAQSDYQQHSQLPQTSYIAVNATQVSGEYQERQITEQSSDLMQQNESQATPSETKQCTVRGCTQLIPMDSPNKMCEACRGRHRIYASTKRARRKMEKAVVAARNAEALGLPIPLSVSMGTESGLLLQASTETPLGWMPQVTPNTVMEGTVDTSPQPSTDTQPTNSWEPAIDPHLSSQTWEDSTPANTASGSIVYSSLQEHQMQLPRPHSSSSELANALTLPVPPPSAVPNKSGTSPSKQSQPLISPNHATPTLTAVQKTSSAAVQSSPALSTNINPYSKYFCTGEHAIQGQSWYLASRNVHSQADFSSQTKSDRSPSVEKRVEGQSISSAAQSHPESLRQEEEEDSDEDEELEEMEEMEKQNENQANQSHAESISNNSIDDVAITPADASISQNIGATPIEAQTTIITDHSETPPKYCSVKGCKKVIPGSYGYKMCPECRTRYRSYGVTKRAKWKAERQAFDREMADLRIAEDEKRLARGEKPLSECPDELREWELSIIDEQVPLPRSVALSLSSQSNENPLNGTGSVSADGSPAPSNDIEATLQPIAGPSTVFLTTEQRFYSGDPSGKQVLNAGTSGEVTYLPSTIDTPLSHSPYPHLNNPLLFGSQLPLPARMCTVSHCHKVLPGFYRYKRCEQHRLQNRYHSKLKRVREKVVKAEGPGEGAEVTSIPSEFEEKPKEKKKTMSGKDGEGKSTKKGKRKADGDDDGNEKETGSGSEKSRTVCCTEECQNLLFPELRWKTCEPCRTAKRKRKTEQRRAERRAREDAELAERQELQSAAVTREQTTQPTSVQQTQATQEDGVDIRKEDDGQRNAVGDVDVEMGTPDAANSIQIRATNENAGEETTSGTPGNSMSLPGSTATTATKDLITLNNADTFRAYRPKTTASAVGRILAKDPHISVDTFSEILLSNGLQARVHSESTSVTSPSPANEPPSVPTPAIPTSTPFVYHPPAKKQRLGTENFSSPSNKDIAGTLVPGSTAATLENATYQLRWKPAILQSQISGTSSTTPKPAAMPTVTGSSTRFVSIAPSISEASTLAPTPPVAPREELPKEPGNVTQKSKDKAVERPSSPTTLNPYTSPYPYHPMSYPYPYYMPPYGMPPPPPLSEASSFVTTPTYPPPYPYPYGYGPVIPSPAYMYNLNRYSAPYGQPGYPPPHAGAYPPPPPNLYSSSLPYPPPPGPYSTPPGYYHTAPYPSSLSHPPPSSASSMVSASASASGPSKLPSQKPTQGDRGTCDPKPNSGDTRITPAANHVRIATQALESSSSSSAPPSNSAVGAAAIPTEVQPICNPTENAISAQPASTETETRKCASKGCTRIPSTGTICEKCKIKLKKHQAKAKQRFKLEPRKSLTRPLGSSSRNDRSSEGPQLTAENV